MLQHRFSPIAALLPLLLALAAGPSQAQGVPPPGAAGAAAAAPFTDPFTVDGIAVDVSAANALEARDRAVAEAQRKAFTILFQRLSDPAARRAPPNISGSELSRLVQGLDVDNERTGATRYVARLAVAFRKNAVRNWFSSQGLTLVEPASAAAPGTPGPVPGTAAAAPAPAAGPTLVLPVWQSKGRAVLLEERTPWRSAWDDFAAGTGNGKVVVPAGELQDVADIGAAEALAGDGRALAKIAARYQAAVVAVVAVDVANRLDPAAGVAVSVRRFAANGAPLGEADSVPVAGTAAEKPGAFLTRVATQVTERLAAAPPPPDESAVTAAAPAAGGAAQDLAAGVPLTRLQDWLDVRARLAQVATVTGVETRLMSRPRYEILVRYRGDPASLRADLERVGLNLLQAAPLPGSPGGGWELSLRGAVPYSPYPIPGGPAPGYSGQGYPSSGAGGGGGAGSGGNAPYPGRPAGPL